MEDFCTQVPHANKLLELGDLWPSLNRIPVQKS